MKKLITIFLVLFSFTILFSQQKPTKEETLQYIKSELEGKKTTYDSRRITSRSNNNWYAYHDDYKRVYSKIDIVSCTLEFSEDLNINTQRDGVFDGEYRVDPIKEKYFSEKEIIDFSRTESIGFLRELKYNSEDGIADPGTKYHVLFFKFNQKKSDGTLEKPAYITVGVFDTAFEDFKSLKIYKAFQHLRKLCGAPEPISFD